MAELYSDQLKIPKTDHTLWRLRCSALGSERWEYITAEAAKSDQQSPYEKHLLESPGFLGPKPLSKGKQNTEELSAFDAALQGARYFSLLQDPDSGIFPCQYKGPMFLTIGYVGVLYCAGIAVPEPVRIELVRFLVNSAHPVDGGWGLHEVDKSTAFGTAINYTLLRLLGLPASHTVCQRARRTLHRLGGAIGVPHWGKCWLSILSLYKWEGVNPAPPELWLLPYALPIHPGRWWVHTRAVYQALGYLSAIKYSCTLTPLLTEIRAELYRQDFETIDFSKHRNTVCNVDLYYPHTRFLNAANTALTFYERYLRPNWLLKYSTAKTYELIKKEIQNTDYLCIAPVSMAFCALVALIEEGRDSYQFQRFVDGFNEVLFMGPKGITVMGTNGAQTWDCAFAIQYYFIAGLAERPEFKSTIENAYKFLCRSQFDTECAPGSFRDKRIGGWPFSTKTQGYTVSDCTAEALKAIIMVKNSSAYSHIKYEISDKRLENSIDVLLSLQNVDAFEYGSFATYEKIRATTAMEKLNPAEVFGNIMVEFPYVECTDSSILGLTYYTKYYSYRKQEIQKAIEIAIKYIKRAQRPDGSWYGSWGICFTYAGMFALEAFSTVGESYSNSEYVRKACGFLVSKQRPDGGWSESMKSSELHSYVEDNHSLVVQTSWALIGLLLAEFPEKTVIKKGVDFLKQRQKANGKWDFEAPEGVFNHSCAIEYASYRFLFPIKALGLYAMKYEK
ncbi:LADA_0B02300g1_1 [Lachancea dasiensis]|uniref:Terpene cyclase/mutase family member n=1 Tax=Lachancea dasiensis TaxID=1072105 RepID=A0A1G4IS59_9SACH|nr:LADA_0B02300g1_1 [Lachancea dasiensis]